MTEVRTSLRQTLGIGCEIFDGFVTKVTDNQTCDVKVFNDDDSILTDIALRSVADGAEDGIIVVPAVGSHVVFAKIEGESDYTLIKTSKIDKVIINCPELIINEGKNKGLVKIKELEDNLDSLKSYIEAIHAALPGAFTAVGVGSAANGATGATTYNSSMSGRAINLVAMENEKVKH